MSSSFIVFVTLVVLIIAIASFRMGMKVNKSTKLESPDAKNTRSYEECLAQNEHYFEYGSFTDSRDGEKYRTIEIGKQVWMAENLRYEATIGSSWCFNEKSDDYGACNDYGRYYGGDALETDDPICPEGYRIPSQKDVNKLIDYMKSQDADVEIFMAKTDLWDMSNENAFEGTNTTGLSMLPGGLRGYNNSGFYETGVFADDTHRFHMWLSDKYNGLVGNYTFLFGNIKQWGTTYSVTDKERGFGIPVRCIKE